MYEDYDLDDNEEDEGCSECGSMQPYEDGECLDCGATSRPLGEDSFIGHEDYQSTAQRAATVFADPGGNSALRAATKNNPRNLPCPTCKQPDRLTPADVAQHYQCDQCADRDERGF